MPNHVTNILRFTGDAKTVQAMREAVAFTNHPGCIDFGKVLPVPENIYMGNLGQAERQLYGKNNWYDWCLANWGTKWNAYDFPDIAPTDGSFRFNTAWNAPHPVIQKLSEMYPDLTIHHLWADEDIGSNCGEKTYKAGQVLDEHYPDYGVRSFDFAFSVLGCKPEDYGLVLSEDGTEYVYCPESKLMEEPKL